MTDLINRQDAINVVAELVSSMSVCASMDECRGMKNMQERAVRAIADLPSAEPDDVGTDACASCPGYKVFFTKDDISDVEILSGLRSQYSCFEEYEEPVYHALSEAIKAVSAQSEPQNPYSICDLCVYNPPSSMDGKPCSMCVAQDKPRDDGSWSYG